VNYSAEAVDLFREGKNMLLLNIHDSCYSVLKGHILWQEKKILKMKGSSAGNRLTGISDIINFLFWEA